MTRDVDWGDVRSVIMREGKHLNISYIRNTLIPLAELKEEPEIMARLDKLCRAARLS